MNVISRRSLLGACALLSPTARTLAQTAARPDGRKVSRVYPSGPPAAIMLYTLAPDMLLGWPRANRAEEREFLLPDVGARPEVGRLTGRGNTANLETVIGLRPDLILDVGTVSETYTTLAARVQEQTGIPYELLDGRFDATPATYRRLGELVDRREKAEELASWCENAMRTLTGRIAGVPESARPRVYYARGPRGLETGLGGSINVETIEFLKARNVAGGARGGLATVSLEQVLAWAPDVIVTIDREFAASVRHDPVWASVPAVRDGRVHLSPKIPFGWVDFPPSVNRFIGLWWLAKILYPDLVPEEIRPLARDFYAKFYHVEVTDAQLDRILAGRS